MSEKNISHKNKSSFLESSDNVESYYRSKDNYNFLEHKKSSNYNKESRLYRLNASDLYEITGKGKIRAIHSNENIVTSKAKGMKARPRSGRHDHPRPWSNKSYKHQNTASSLGRAGSRKNIFSTSSNNNQKKTITDRRFNFHRSKVDDIICQADTLAKVDNYVAKQMPRKYWKLQGSEDARNSFGVSGMRIAPEMRSSSKTSMLSNVSNDRPKSTKRAPSYSQPIKIIKQNDYKTIGGIPIVLLTNLFNAKWRDLELLPKEGQLRRFFDFCSKSITGRKYIFREIGLGFHSVKELGCILRLNKCSHLDLRKNVLGNKGLKELAKAIQTNSSLVHIDIGSNDITFEGANSFFLSMRTHNTLTSINIANSDGLHRNRIGPKGCIGLNELMKQNKCLSMIDISDNTIGSEGIKTLLNGITSSMVNLIYINLSNNDLGQEWIPQLGILMESESLQEIRLSSNNFTDSWINDISLFFYGNKWKLRKLDLSNNKITCKGATKLFQSLKNNEYITHLNLENNQNIGNGDLTEIVMFFRNNEKLENINLSNWGLHENNVKDMVEGLHIKDNNNFKVGNNTLNVLNISNNSIRDEGAKQLANLIMGNNNIGLKTIDISWNIIGDEGGVAIAKALSTNSTITKLSLKTNILKDETAIVLTESLKTNKTILKIVLDRNSIKRKHISEIKDLLLENQELVKQKLLPQAREEMIMLLQKDQEQLNAGDKNFDFSKCNFF